MTTKNIKGQWYNKRIVRTRSASRMVKIEVVVLLLVESVNCAFFDLTDVDDPLSLLWHHPKNVSGKQANIPCRVPVSPHSGSVILGQCRYKTLCLLSGGEAHSNDACGSFLTCCTQPSVCSKRTKSKVSYFTKDQSAAASYCEHVVEIQSKVCQIRLDFEQFRLAPSTNVKVDANLFHTVCDTDNMTVNPEVQRVPYFCGNNDGQHAYVHLDSQTELRLQVQLGAQGNLNRYWRIKVTQIECPLFWRFLGNSYKSLSYGFNSGENFPLLAPPGAAQYFTEPVGTIRSFGYKDSESEYISGLYYAIAFKKTPRVNCIKFTTNYIVLRSVNPPQNGRDGHCIDYLFIPELEIVSGTVERYGSQVCSGQPTLAQIFYSEPPGPLYIHFRSKSANADNSPGHAFDIQYELTSCARELKP